MGALLRIPDAINVAVIRTGFRVERREVVSHRHSLFLLSFPGSTCFEPRGPMAYEELSLG